MNSRISIKSLKIFPKVGKCDVTFRGGLNVIWAHSVKGISITENILNSVGKTTFVKLIDYILGSKDFITGYNTDTIKMFKDKKLVGEVVFGEDRYTITRDIVKKPDSKIMIYCDWVSEDILNDSKLDAVHMFEELDDYNTFIEEKAYQGNLIFNGKRFVSHRSIMNYLIRDQKLGFIKFDSGIKEENATERKKRLDVLLGLMTDEKERLSKDIADLKKEKDKNSKEKSVLLKYFKLNSDKTVARLRREIESNKKKMEMLKAELREKKLNLDKYDLERDSLNERKKAIQQQIDMIKDNMYVLSSKKVDYKRVINDITVECRKVEEVQIAYNLLNHFEYQKCPIFLKNFKDKNVKCGYLIDSYDSIEDSTTSTAECEGNAQSKELSIQHSEKKKDITDIISARKKILSFEKHDIVAAVEKVEVTIKSLKIEQKDLAKEIKAIDLELKKLDDVSVYQVEELKREIDTVQHEIDILEIDLRNFNYTGTLQNKIKSLGEDIRSKKDALDSLSSNRALELNTIYNNIVKFTTENTKAGRISLTTYAPQIMLKSGGVDTGAAVTNLSVICFDLAIFELALKYKEIGRYYPKILIHDSPRQHEMQSKMYRKVFDYIIKLEEKYPEAIQEFQYIITTLDISENVEKDSDKYVRLELDDSGNGGKLFGRDCEI